MEYIKNPIIPGFNPDPSIIRVKDDYYIATSTFEWFPGVQIHHSKDLINWKLIAHPLNRISQLNMDGNPNSCGVWAPCLSYDNGIFYLIYTNVKSFEGIWQDTHNYLVTTTDISKEWSEPIYLNSSGFDPSLFHDDDGRKWLVNMVWDFRKGKNLFGGILLQEYSHSEKRLIGPINNIFKGTELGYTEGPHIYKFDGYYYMIIAEGGTELNHAVMMVRSKYITGPYEVNPRNPILTSRNSPKLIIQKAGHADIVESQNGELYMVHLGSRPLVYNGKCVLGRETYIQRIVWTNDKWLSLENGANIPKMDVIAPDLPKCPCEKKVLRDDFETGILDINYQTLRIPLGEDSLSLIERPGYLRLKGKESLISKHHQSLVARRQQAFCFTATTCVEFEPEWYKQMAGLVCYYNTKIFYYLRITYDEDMGKCLGIVARYGNKFDYPMENDICIEGLKRIHLRVVVDYEKLQFYYSSNERTWDTVGPVLDTSILSDEYAQENGEWYFTGAFIGICCQDLSGQDKHADFDYFEYIERDSI